MKISNNKIQKILQSYNSQQVNKKDTKTSRLSKKDELKLSTEAKDFQTAMKAVKKIPDIRQEKVTSIKRQVETGTYEIDSGKIVEKMLSNVELDKRI
ncbi:flagellar biosynthesis anti-sigma factor FlgM [Sporosalibacterium faouarense]|uniref:flagellar biosynthesis anti-sigma factor FlgM n=1 Tax=Sporosalibacterium faouarense TaxID=516123 RepID=UPI00141C7607|nr:flagellar biosynthesis anti-sigma factor FlgM [Sporosalibacterium faouarense]MTI46809.1 flagellar biosynthesis anti-sigma factor FlgM [Bacillota bacterium]